MVDTGIIKKLSLGDKIRLTAGQDFWRTWSSKDQGVPYAKLTDGPNGARGGGSFIDPVPAALFPSPSCLGSTFDIDLAFEMGKGIALDSRSKKCHVVLGPTINMTRDQRHGRTFENYGEDPQLSGHLGAHWTLGCQSVGVGATPKHLVANEAEKDRRFSNSIMTEATLREQYLEPFRVLFKEVAAASENSKDDKSAPFGKQPSCIMTAYNQINGVSASENEHTLIDVLRKEWGFDGLVMSDWFAMHANAFKTCDLEMPGPTLHRIVPVIEAKVLAKQISEQDIEDRGVEVIKLLNKIAPLGFSDSPGDEHEESILDDKREEVIRRIAAEGSVLLKNDGNILPLELNGSKKKIALIGLPWVHAFQSGGGSANLKPQKAVKPIDALRAGLEALPNGAGKQVELVHHLGCDLNPFPAEIATPAKLEFLSGSTKAKRAFNSKTDLIASHKLDSPVFTAAAPKPDGCKPNDFNIRATFQLKPGKAGTHKLGLTCLGSARVHIKHANGHTALDWSIEGERDFFEFGLNECKWAQTHPLQTTQANEPLHVTLEYTPAYQEDPGVATLLPAGFRIGLDEEKDHIGSLFDAAKLAASADLTLIMTATGSLWEAEGYDRPDLKLPLLQNQLVDNVATSAGAGKCVVLNVTGSAVEMPWLDKVSALVQTWYGGQEAAEALVDVLLGRGDAPASGRMCSSWPVKITDQPSGSKERNFPGVDDHGRGHPDVYYDEGRLVGYKWYEARHIEPMFWFGSGLCGYTTFERRLINVAGTVTPRGDQVSIDVEVQNTGKRNGKDVVQVYLEMPAAIVQGDVPRRKLAAFSAIKLAAGDKGKVSLTIGYDNFSHWDGDREGGKWTVKAGTYAVVLAASANPKDEIARKEVTVNDTWTWKGLGNGAA